MLPSVLVKNLGRVGLVLITLVTTPPRAKSQEYYATRLTPLQQEAFLQDCNISNTTVRCGFVPYKTQCVAGEPLHVSFLIKNVGTNDFEFRFGGDYRGLGRHDRFNIVVTDTNGNILPDPVNRKFFGGGFVQTLKLKANDTFTNILDLTSFRVVDNPGIYVVDCGFDLFDLNPFNRTNLFAKSHFQIEILARTPERVAKVLDELADEAKADPSSDSSKFLNLAARFGTNSAVPYLARLAHEGPIELRTAAISSLSLIPSDASLDALREEFLKDSNPAIRIAAASSIGVLRQPRGVDTLLVAFLFDKPPVKEAILRALGTSQSERAFPVLTNALDSGSPEIKQAAIDALVSFGGTNSIQVLREHINTNFLSLRYQIVCALVEQLHQPVEPEWLMPILAGRQETREWIDSIRLLRMYAGEKAMPTLLSCVDFDVPWSGRNWWILEAVRILKESPKFEYEYDPNSDGTHEQWEKNHRTLMRLKPLAGPAPPRPVTPLYPPVPYLKTDPQIDFTPQLKDLGNGEFEIQSGFIDQTESRGGGEDLKREVSEPFREVYRTAALFRGLPKNPKRCADLNITAQQIDQLKDLLHQFAVKLSGPLSSEQKVGNLYNLLLAGPEYSVSGQDWDDCLIAYKEAPPGPLKKQAKEDLLESHRIFSQNYHAGTVEFAEAAKKIFPADQLKQILK